MKIKNKKIVAIAAICLVACLVGGLINHNTTKKDKPSSKFWDVYKLGNKLPKPDFKVKRDDVYQDDEEGKLSFSAEVSGEEYSEYLKKCKKAGFNITAHTEDEYFAKYNDKGYLLTIDEYSADSDEIECTLYDRVKFSKITWPQYNDCAKILPIPKSKYGKVINDNNDDFEIQLGKTSYSEYKAYVNQVFNNKKISVEYNKSDYSFFAYDANKQHKVFVDYLGNKNMLISVIVNKEERKSATTNNSSSSNKSNNTTTENASATNKQANGNSDTIRIEVKKAIDDYENFMKEYVAFMDKYQHTSDTSSMLSEYNTMMQKYQTMNVQFQNIQSKYTLNKSELDYYIKAQNRVNELLLK